MIIPLCAAMIVLATLAYNSVQIHKTNTNIKTNIENINKGIKIISKGVKDLTPMYTIHLKKDVDPLLLKIKFRNKDNKIIPSWFLIDTGADVNFITPELLPDIQYEDSKEEYQVSAVDGKNEKKSCNAVFTAAGCPTQYKGHFIIQEFDNVNINYQENYGITIGGIIGREFLVKRNWQIDNIAKKIRIYQ